MDKVLNKFGIYDLMGVLLSGFIILSISILVYNISALPKIVTNDTINETLLFLIGSYLIGLVFQEIGSLIDKNCFSKNNRMLKQSLRTKIGKEKTKPLVSHLFMNENEKVGVYRYVLKKLKVKIPAEINLNESKSIIDLVENSSCDYDDIFLNQIYHYCKYYLIKSGFSANLDKEQSISALCRSLCVYFFLLATASFVYACYYFCCCKDIPEWFVIIFFIALLLFLLFLNKFQRHAQIRHIFVFRWFYYNVVEAELTHHYTAKIKVKKKNSDKH